VANLKLLRLYGNFISDPPSELKDRLPITIETGELNFNANGGIVLAVLTGQAGSGQETLSCGAFGFFSPEAPSGVRTIPGAKNHFGAGTLFSEG
jgi:hypothetical protein